MNNPSGDTFQRFFFEHLGIRGEIVQLADSWLNCRGQTDYEPLVESQLGQALSAVVLLSGTIKFKGSLLLQIRGCGPVTTLVAQATHTRHIRGLASCREPVSGSGLEDIYGSDARMVLTIQNDQHEPYQGIVAVEGDSLAVAVENYFNQSEQLPTRLWLAANASAAGGLFLQALPGQSLDREDWNRINHLADTITDQELLTLPASVLLYRLFHEEDLRLLEPEPVVFRCRCSRERIENVLLSLGPEESESILEQEGAIKVQCEFCARQYTFDRVDIGALFSEPSTRISPADTRH